MNILYFFLGFIFLIVFDESNCVENNQTLEVLWNLTRYALDSRQNSPTYTNRELLSGEYVRNPYRRPLTGHKNQNEILKQYYHPQYQHPNVLQHGQFPHQNYWNYGVHTKYPTYPITGPQMNYGNYGLLRPQIGYPHGPNLSYPQKINSGPLSFLPSRESFMEALDSIARNDELHCVPRILCEVTSGTLNARQSGLGLPFNINMESIIGLLAGMNGVDSNPLLSFGKAALLGYSSKGNAGTCMYAYPQCPRDPDKLVEYLNNYNGGFFRFFQGINPQNSNGHFDGYRPQFPIPMPPFRPSIQGGQLYGLYNPYGGYNYKANKAEKRILTKPSEFDYIGNRFPDNRQQKGIKFPNGIDESNNEINPNNFHSHNGDFVRTLKFPISDEGSQGLPLRKPKQLPDFDFNFQRPSPYHRPTPMIFPDRTGTGELKFTLEELNENYRRPFALQNNNLISFNSETNNDASYYIDSMANGLGEESYDFNRQNNRFFPS